MARQNISFLDLPDRLDAPSPSPLRSYGRVLAGTLDVPVPDVPFPRVNDSKLMQRNYLFLQVYGAAMWILYAGALAIAILLLSWWK
jgi:hypothetical protein